MSQQATSKRLASTHWPEGDDVSRHEAIGDGKTVYVIHMDGKVTPIDTATNKPGTPIPAGKGPCPQWRAIRHACGGLLAGNFVISPDGKTAYVLTGSTVTPINTATNTPGKPIHVAGAPYGVIAITP